MKVRGYCRYPRLSVCPSVRLSVRLSVRHTFLWRELLLHFWRQAFNFIIEWLHIACRCAWKFRNFEIVPNANKRPKRVKYSKILLWRELLLHFWRQAFDFIIEWLHIACRCAWRFRSLEIFPNVNKRPIRVKWAFVS